MNSPKFDTVCSPFDGAPVGQMPYSYAAEVERAITAAHLSFQTMRKIPRFLRADILERTAKVVDARQSEFVSTIAAEAGKPLFDAHGEVSRAIFDLSNAAAEARRYGGHEVPLDMDAGVYEYQTTRSDGGPLNLLGADFAQLAAVRQRIGIARRYPIGPILAISPFNFPLNLVVQKVAPALAVGNSVVLKPASQTPLTAQLLADAFSEAGLPEGVFNVVHCDVSLAERMVRDERFAMVTFTGSASVGWHIKSIAGKKRVSLELGGNAAVIVCDDADLDLAAARCVRGGVVYGGQYCIGVQRILVDKRVHDNFLEKIVSRVKACTVGDPMCEGVDVGPVIDERSAVRIQTWIDEARAAGAEVLTGGHREKSIVQPTVIARSAPGMRIEDEEIFGPVLTVNPFDRFDEAVSRANATKYGLQGGLFTTDLRRAFSAIDDWDVGGLIVNDVPIYRVDNMPFGGWKESGLGREGTVYAMDEMTDIKHLVINYSS